MSDSIYSVWFQQCLGYGSQKIKDILNHFGSAENIYNTPVSVLRESRMFTQKQINHFSSYTLEDARVIIEKCERYNYTILSIEDSAYPRRLYEISNPPCVLYVSGKMPDVDSTLTIGIVGTRTATSEGIRNSFTFGSDLSKCGAIVVSGGALGVDCASHRGVLQSDGVTICVLGCGINVNYLSENAQMRKLITNKGAVISEYPPDTKPASYNFPARNRIISGLSNGVLVIEAGVKSGSLITAQLALEQNRDVFSVPGSLINAKAQGSNALLKQGAITVTSYKDIIEEYENQYEISIEYESGDVDESAIAAVPVAGRKTKTNFSLQRDTQVNKTNGINYNINDINMVSKPTAPSKCPEGISEDARRVYEVLSDDPMYIDQISEALGLAPQIIMSALTELEIFDGAEVVSGGRYLRK